MTHTRWQQLRDIADRADAAALSARFDLEEMLKTTGWKLDPDLLAGRCPWINPKDGGHFDFEAAVLLEEGRDDGS